MSFTIPNTLTRLQTTMWVQGAELSVVDRGSIIYEATKDLARQASHKLMQDCIKSDSEYQGHPSSRLVLDVYVLAPHELYRLLEEAQEAARTDALRWTSYKFEK